MRHTRPGNRPDRLQLHIAVIDVEEARATTEENRNDVNLQFVDEAGGEILLRDVGSAAKRHILAIRCPPGLLERRLDAVGDEKECRASLHRQRFGREMGEHENRVWYGGLSPTNPSKDPFPMSHGLRRTYCDL